MDIGLEVVGIGLRLDVGIWLDMVEVVGIGIRLDVAVFVVLVGWNSQVALLSRGFQKEITIKSSYIASI